MAVSVDINLPKSHRAEFPDRCVVCGCDSPGSHVRVITGSIGWWTWLLWIFGLPYVVKAPACSGCSWKLHGLRLLSLAVTITVVVVALVYLRPIVVESVPGRLGRYAMMGLALLCLLPQIIFEVFYAKPFDVTAFSKSVDYEFTSEDYATEFALLNQDAAWVKINGERL